MIYKIFKINEKINNKNFIFRQPKKINDYTKFISILYNNENEITPFLFQTPTIKLCDNIIDNYIKIPIKTKNNKTELFKSFINNISDIIIENYKLNYKKWNIDIIKNDINYTELINEVEFDDDSPLQNDYNDGLLNIKLNDNVKIYNSNKDLISYDEILLLKNIDIQAIIELKGLNIIYLDDNKINLDPILIIHQIKCNNDNINDFEVKLDNYSILDTEMPTKNNYIKINSENNEENSDEENSEEDIKEILNSETSNEESDIHSDLESDDEDDSINEFLVKIQN